MGSKAISRSSRRRRALGIAIAVTLCVAFRFATQKDKGDFPDGYDALQTAPETHKVIFENSLVRVLEVSIPTSRFHNSDASSPLAEFFPKLGHGRQVAACAVSAGRWLGN